MKLLFLYTELSFYIENCFKKLIEFNFELLVVHYPINQEAPFKFKEDLKINFITYSHYKHELILQSIEKFFPEIIFCSGWNNLFYLKIAKKYKRLQIPVVLCFDNKWLGSFRQNLACFMLKVYFSNRFTHAWVPGKAQREFAIRLGFKNDAVQTGFYTADTEFFEKIYFERKNLPDFKYPKRFIFIGRYLSIKGLEDLWSAFNHFSVKFPDWELWSFGTGTLVPTIHPKIKHLGFKQPDDLYPYLLDGGVFVLPSRFEPWGVIVHEMACAGFPLLLSDNVGAAEPFLISEENGFLFKSNDVKSCLDVLEKIAMKSNNELVEMGDKSHFLSKSNSPELWVETIKKFLK